MRKLVTCIVFSLGLSFVTAQKLKVDTAYTAENLVDKILVGNGIRVGNVNVVGQKQSICYFNIDTNVIGMKSGILMSTGNVFDIPRENKSPGTTGISWDNKKNRKYKKDKDLYSIMKIKTYDHISLEFDFVAYHNNVTFNFSFASEEYKEYVGSRFNDIFAFILSGHNYNSENLVVIPGTNEPITINNINHKRNDTLFINNDYFLNFGLMKKNKPPTKKVCFIKKWWNGIFNKKNKNKEGYYTLDREKKKLNQIILKSFEYDGFTKVLSAHCFVVPYQLYHLKIVVADVGDAAFDSGVFLEADSFNSNMDTTAPDFKKYADLHESFNWDSIFNLNKKIDIDTLPIIDDRFEITNVYFATDKDIIPDSSKAMLNQLAEYLNKNKGFKLSITGYTDNKGSKKYNQTLSEKRALSVTEYLKLMGVEDNRIKYEGQSSDNPISDNTVERGRALNRRVELTIISE